MSATAYLGRIHELRAAARAYADLPQSPVLLRELTEAVRAYEEARLAFIKGVTPLNTPDRHPQGVSQTHCIK